MIKVTTVVKLRLSLDERTASILDSQSRICNWLYNHLLEQANGLKESFKKTKDRSIGKILYSKLGLRNLVPKIKTEHPFLKVVHSSPLKNVALRLTNSIQTYQQSRKVNKDRKSGWPRFRSWKARWFSLLYDEPNKGFNVDGNELQLSLGLGLDRKRHTLNIPIQETRLLKDKIIHNLRIVKQAGIYFAIFTVSKILPQQKIIQNVIALDPNHKNIAYGVNTHGQAIEIEAPYWLKTYDKRIDEIRSKRDRCQKKAHLVDVLDTSGNPIDKKRWESSRRWKNYHVTLERLLAKRREQTKTFCFTLAHQLFHEHELVAIGDYTPKGGGITTPMRRSMNNRSLIGRLKKTLSWVAQKKGKWYEEFPEFGTTRTCNHCGYCPKEGIPPSIREWICPDCQTFHIRDENSALNGLSHVLRNRESNNRVYALSVPCSGRVFVKERWAWSVRSRGVVKNPRGSDCDSIISFKKFNEAHCRASSKLDHVH